MLNKNKLIKAIISKYPEICVLEDSSEGVIFELNGGKYEIFIYNDDVFPIVCTVDNYKNSPHFMYNCRVIDGKSYQSICLFEAETLIQYIHTDEEKIRLCIEQLIKLTNMSKRKMIEEYHKEFIYYWNIACKNRNRYADNKYQLFLDNEDSYQWLEQQIFKNEYIRMTTKKRFFNDSNRKVCVDRIPILYLPLIDIRMLVPPLNGKPWGASEICDIIRGITYQRISSDAYREIVESSYSKKSIVLVFKLNTLYFGCIVEFKNPGTAKLICKFESQIEQVIPIKIKRCDFEFLNNQIGNKTYDKKISIIGAGSLGSYIAGELVRAGYKNIDIIDGDNYGYENTFRHRIGYFSPGYAKSKILQSELNWLHPELNVKGINKNLDANTFKECNIDSADIVIFTVGSSDVQLQLNKVLRKNKFNKTIIYTWLEYDGETSHVVVINNADKGCFECLYTNEQGDLCGNIINKVTYKDVKYIRDGCGGTRIPYGNKTLLNTTSLLLKALSESNDNNTIYSYVKDTVICEDFPYNERCNCCGICE